jgi:pimeloyl-ACP methyl ester carboxylesterase
MLTVALPTQVMWGMQDIALPGALLDGLDDYVAQLQVHRVADASHWIIHEQPALVAQLLAGFLGGK